VCDMNIPLEYGHSLLVRLELGAVAEGGYPGKGLESRAGAVVLHSGLIFSGVGLNDLVVEPHVSDSHSVLGEGSCLVRADGGGGSQGLDGFQVLDQAILGGHALGGERQTHSDSGEQTFGHVGHDDTNEEDDSVQPMVAEDESNDEEGHTQEDSHTSDQVDEMVDFLGDGGLAGAQTGGQASNTSHDSVVSAADDNAHGGTCEFREVIFSMNFTGACELCRVLC
jgi:hypothetical protein